MDIFKIINPEKNQEKPAEEKRPPIKSTMQEILEQGPEDDSKYVIEPLKKFILKSKLEERIIDDIKRLYDQYDERSLYQDFKIAMYKKLDLTKIQIQRFGRTYNILEYMVHRTYENERGTAIFAKCLIVNQPKFKDKKIIDRCLLLLMEQQVRARNMLLECDRNFLKLYKLLIDNGAKSMNVESSLFSQRGELISQNINLVELLLYENDPQLTQKVLEGFYFCTNPQNMYPVLQRYGIKPNLDDALEKLRYANCDFALRYLIEIGEFKKQDITDERVKAALQKSGVNNPDVIQKAILRANEVKAGRVSESGASGKPKVATKQALSANQEINRLFDQAVKNSEENTK